MFLSDVANGETRWRKRPSSGAWARGGAGRAPVADPPLVQPFERAQHLRHHVEGTLLAEALVLQDLVEQVLAPRLEDEDVVLADAQLAEELDDILVLLRALQRRRLCAQLANCPCALLVAVDRLDGDALALGGPGQVDGREATLAEEGVRDEVRLVRQRECLADQARHRTGAGRRAPLCRRLII